MGKKAKETRPQVTTRSEKKEKPAMEFDNNANANSPSPHGLDHSKDGLLARIYTKIRAVSSDVKSELNSFCLYTERGREGVD